MLRWSSSLSSAACCLLLAQCDCGGAIRATDYDQSCTADEDCVPVADGEKCSIERCGCPDTAINVAEQERYERDLALTPCVLTPLNSAQCVCPPDDGAVCNDGICALRTANL